MIINNTNSLFYILSILIFIILYSNKDNNDILNLYGILILLSLLIVLYFLIMKKIYKNKVIYKDILNKKIINLPILGKNCCSWWPISHFISFFIWGYIWSKYWYHLFFLGIMWEVVEYIMKKKQTKEGQILKFKRTRNSDGTVEYEQWWSSSSKDILFNGVGIMCGYLLNKYKKRLC